MIITVVANILLLMSLATTAALGWAIAPRNVPHGPDSYMYGWVCIFIQTPRWICLTSVLLMCVAAGGVPWPADHGGQYALVITVQLLLGTGCFLAIATSLQKMSNPQWMSRSLLLMPMVIPAMQILFAGWVLNPWLRSSVDPVTTAAVTRWGWILFTLTGLFFAVIAAIVYVTFQLETARLDRQANAVYRANEAARLASIEEKFRSLSPADPLPEWLNYLAFGSSDPRNAIVIAAVAQRPELAAEIQHELQVDDLNAECRTLQAIELFPPAATAGLVEPFRMYGIRLCDILHDAIADADIDSRRNKFGYAQARASTFMAAARGLHKAGADVRPQLRAVADLVRTQDFDSTRDIVRVYDFYLKELSIGGELPTISV